MKAMVLAAGRGERMRPLTDATPKPLLRAGGHPLIDYPLRALAAAGVREVVVNLSWHAAMLRDYLGEGGRYGLSIHVSDEGPVPLQTGGGIQRALAWLGEDPFLLVNGDVWTDYPLSSLVLPDGSLAHLVLVDNPPHHPQGDFSPGPDGHVREAGPRLTYAGVGLLHPGLFAGCGPGRFPLKPLLDRALSQGRLTAEYWRGHWLDVGTPARLAELDEALRRGKLLHPALAPAGGDGRSPAR